MSVFTDYTYYRGSKPCRDAPEWLTKLRTELTCPVQANSVSYAHNLKLSEEMEATCMYRFQTVVGDVASTLTFLDTYSKIGQGYICHAARRAGGTGMVLNVQSMLAADGIDISGDGFNVMNDGFPWWLIAKPRAGEWPKSVDMRRIWAQHAARYLSARIVMDEEFN